MSIWKITWFDGTNLREAITPMCDIYSLASFVSSSGVNNTYAIFKIERMPV